MTSAQLLAERKRVATLHKRQRTPLEIVDETGLSHALVVKAIKLFETGGMDALKPKTGRTEGSGRTITPEQEDKIKNILYTKQPYDVRIIHLAGEYYTAPREDELTEEMLPYKNEILNGDSPQYLWCRDSVRALVEQISGIELSPQAVRNYLQRWGFPKAKQNQRPISRCSQEIQEWINNNPPEKECSKRYWLYQERLNTDGKQSKISATDDHRKEYWTVIQGNLSQEKQAKFLKQLNKQTGSKIIVVRYDYNHYTGKEFNKFLKIIDIHVQPPLLDSEKERLDNDRAREAEVHRELSQEWFDKRNLNVEVHILRSVPDPPTTDSPFNPEKTGETGETGKSYKTDEL